MKISLSWRPCVLLFPKGWIKDRTYIIFIIKLQKSVKLPIFKMIQNNKGCGTDSVVSDLSENFKSSEVAMKTEVSV